MSTENKALAYRWFEEVWNKGRVEAIDEMLDPNMIAHGLGKDGSDLRGTDGFKIFHTKFRGAFPDIRITVEDVIAEGDRVAIRFSGSASHRGDHLGVPATQRPVTFTGMAFIRCRNGKIVEGWNNFDVMGLMQQIGAAPSADVLA
jgi:steroid delta-isomerase-like uncharacterized protein